ncbi:MAG: hypothetical protein M1834_009076 [Cirrosporium novae-zelandiae]|nr:MAG: hypothetical protein M1834_009076 [Cirrosporium novae-zelandiae]
MDWSLHLSLCLLLLGTSIISTTIDKAYIVQLPIQSTVFVLCLLGVALITLGRKSSYLRPQAYESLPLDDRDLSQSSRSSSPAPRKLPERHTLSNRQLRALFMFTIVGLVVRLDISRRIFQQVQCAQSNIEVLILPPLAGYDFWRHKRWIKIVEESEPDESAYEALVRRLRGSRFRYVVSALILSYASLQIALIASGTRSTYICLTAEARMIHSLQWVGLALDYLIFIAVNELIGKHSCGDSNGRINRSISILGWILVITAITIFMACLVTFILKPDNGAWFISFPKPYLASLIKYTIMLIATVLSACHLLQRVGALELTTITVATYTLVIGITYMWRNSYPFPSIPSGAAFLSIFLIMVAMTTFSAARTVESRYRNHVLLPSWFHTLIMFGVLSGLIISLRASKRAAYHPIDLLIFQAKAQHEDWAKQASVSQTLEEAIIEYRRRYRKNPPPGFDDWYNFAISRSSAVIDDYDQIHNDLLPFWAMNPSDIRELTWQITSNPWNEIFAINIRNGKAEVNPSVIPTHRWMLLGVASMINQFAQYLPDMDLAFNINDESRVAVPYEELQQLRSKGKKAAETSVEEEEEENPWKVVTRSASKFSQGRNQTWKPIGQEITDTVFSDHSFHDTFSKYARESCPPNSRARKEYRWDVGQLCTTCAHPHSLGQFLQNWTLAASPCHQPDLASLHGFFTSPAAFKTTQKLVPVFSQSKVGSYNDILYPSAWNYLDKVKYAPTDAHPDRAYFDKQNTLFWRGATSEGVSIDGTWRGMVRQRLVHLANNLTSSDLIPLLILSSSHHGKLSYHSIPGPALQRLFSTDIHLADHIARCRATDCQAEASELGLVPAIDFQDHWNYRYLFDLDGAGFSGRFLPFLRSNSIPFKSALFREWYDARVTAWWHFVPQDVRLQGVHSTLAYFAGVEGSARLDGGGAERDVSLGAHVKEGEMIAEAGREWANKALRKEDMEVYFFRLLLEWGRLTDDLRDQIGFH